MGVQIEAEDINISHYLPISSKYTGKRCVSAIFVEFVRCTKEEENHICINESLTERNKELFNAAFKVKKDCSYDFIWTSNGKIFQNKDSPAKLIRSQVGLNKLKKR